MSEPPAGMELARVWVAGGELHCELNAGAFDDPAVWGEVLADLARHVAQGMYELEGRPIAQTLATLRRTFEQELEQE